MSEIKIENLIKEKPIQVSIEKAKKVLFQMENCICEINGAGIGYLCKIPFPNNNNNLLPILITNNSILNENDKVISISINKSND